MPVRPLRPNRTNNQPLDPGAARLSYFLGTSIVVKENGDFNAEIGVFYSFC